MTKNQAIAIINKGKMPVHISTYEIGNDVRSICMVFDTFDKYYSSYDALPKSAKLYMSYGACVTTNYYHNGEYQFTCKVYTLSKDTNENITKDITY